jgi:hypothetical protein
MFDHIIPINPPPTNDRSDVTSILPLVNNGTPYKPQAMQDNTRHAAHRTPRIALIIFIKVKFKV